HATPAAGVWPLAAERAAAGVDASGFYDRLHRRMHPESAALLAQGLARHELRLGGRLALVCLDREVMDRMNRADFDSDGLIDTLRSLDGIEVVAVLKEVGRGAGRGKRGETEGAGVM